MPVDSRAASAGLFDRGLTNLKAQLIKAEAYAVTADIAPATLLSASLAVASRAPGSASPSPFDLFAYTLAAHVHWAAEGATLAIARLLGNTRKPDTTIETTFADLYRRLDATIDHLRLTAPGDIEAGLNRTIVVEARGGPTSAVGSQFLVGYAIPHFAYHVTTAYSILRSQGVPLTMADYLGNWGDLSSRA
jgi:hypothetical protein